MKKILLAIVALCFAVIALTKIDMTDGDSTPAVSQQKVNISPERLQELDQLAFDAVLHGTIPRVHRDETEIYALAYVNAQIALSKQKTFNTAANSK